MYITIILVIAIISMVSFLTNPRIREEEAREERARRVRAEKARMVEDKKSSYYRNNYINSVYTELGKEEKK